MADQTRLSAPLGFSWRVATSSLRVVSIIYDSRRTGGRAIAPRAGSTSAVVVSSTQRERAVDEARAPPLGVAREKRQSSKIY